MGGINPCMTCGACCAYFHIFFYWTEADDVDGLMPPALTEPLTSSLRYVNDTNQRQNRCAVLSGDIGDIIHCTIYENRPSPCREFAISGENGEESDACNRARARHGLSLLRPLYKDIPALDDAESTIRERFAVRPPASQYLRHSGRMRIYHGEVRLSWHREFFL